MAEEAGKPGKPEESNPPGDASQEECRCKEATRRTLPELLRLMARDLAFWRNKKDIPRE
jgi:hypothetical protein